MRDATKALFLATGALLMTGAAPAQQGAAPPVPLIERAKLFGNPTRAGGQLSPDGRWISFLAPRDGVMNVWVAPATAPDQAKPLTAEKLRPIRQTFWSPDSRQIMFINDVGGDENFLLYGVDVASGEQKNLTPFQKTRVIPVKVSKTVTDRVLIGVNNRDPRWHDVYSLQPATGKLDLVFRNDGYSSFVADEQLNLRLAAKPRADAGSDWFRIVDGTVEAKPVVSYGLDDSQTTAPLAFTRDGKILYWTDARGRDQAAIFAQDVATGRMTPVAQSAKADVSGGLFDPKTGRLQAYADYYLKNEYKPVDASVRGDLDFLRKQNKGEFYVTSRTDADDKWLVTFDPVSAPSETHLYDRAAKRLTRLYVSRPELVGAPLRPMQAVEVPARDGLTMVSYLTRPAGYEDRPAPMVLVVHGGPWARDGYGYNSTHQWLANRGYAVMSVNYRGSTGFGKKFVSAADLQWGRKMHDDLIDAVDWAVKQGVTTPDKVAIMGGSYGGYATLAGLTFTPDKFACGVDIVGPSNLFTLLQTIPPYWEAVKLQFYKRMGDPNTEEGRALLKERSPLTYVDRIKKPLLIGQGANDPRVNVRESDQIVEVMKAKNIPVTYVLFPDEGHGFARPANNIAFNAVAENFLAPCLGGRAEPIGQTLAASSAQVKHGAEYVRGLNAQTAAK
ncbi:S9 family peptidase [Sphingomonas lenta]|uniref:S9 family peptidase n=1 Tax=Sphingomonas lenta TaxID=1141887 RepID=A0A2A2SCW0_9SPHN|nr:S9 family peptidase [Sphingomonas lenta]